MAENTRAPVAIRIVRPYETEDELLAHELETIGKTSVVLIGAHPRPTGVILRFEVTLASGATVLRGEGRVLAHKENAFRGQAGLTLRFTRLDPKSKSVVDRATAMRETRAGGEPTPSRPAPSLADSPVADALTQSTPAPAPTSARPPAARVDADVSVPSNPNADQEAAVASARASARERANATARANAKRTGSGRPSALTPPPVPVTELSPDELTPDSDRSPPEPTPVTSIPGEVSYSPRPDAAPVAQGPAPSQSAPPPLDVHVPVPVPESPSLAASPPHSASRPAASSPLSPPPDRAQLLARLRDRAATLPPARVEEILKGV